MRELLGHTPYLLSALLVGVGVAVALGRTAPALRVVGLLVALLGGLALQGLLLGAGGGIALAPAAIVLSVCIMAAALAVRVREAYGEAESAPQAAAEDARADEAERAG